VYEAETSVFSENSIASLANGIRVKSKQGRERPIDRLQSKSHGGKIEVAKALQLM
jgi:hypothetical protein